MKIKLNNEQLDLDSELTAYELAIKLKLTSPNQAIGVQINGENKDLSTPLKEGDEIHFWSFDDPEGKEIFWHSSAHILAQAVLRLWPNAKPTIGPPIENGFYYDFADLKVSEDDFKAIETEMKKIISENFTTHRKEFNSKSEAIKAFEHNPFKKELIESFEEGAPISAYQQGEFVDLCRGPHLYNLNKVKALKVLKTSGAYWKGNSENQMLTRIYGITFPDKQLLKDYLYTLEEAKKRDHKALGPALNLFSLKEWAPGLPFIHPKGMWIWNKLVDYWRELHYKHGYLEIKTPLMMSRELWEISGHWDNYRENMYTSKIEERDFAIKPMNCPGCLLHYKSEVHSYRELPLKIAELGLVHRYEPSGALSGLFRVRGFHQDDAHIFMKKEDIESEIIGVLSLSDELYSLFGLSYHLELSTRPESKTIGSDKDWEFTTQALQNALDSFGKDYKINEGDGAFYGPKIDLHIKDALGRTWQCGTIQLDMSLPERFELEYVNDQGNRVRPIMIHRAIFGSLERFLGILIEHYAGKFPLWLSPRQIVIIPVADRHEAYAQELSKLFISSGFNCEVDNAHESVSKKVRQAQLNKTNYILTVGDTEVENRTISLRTRDNVVHGETKTDEFIKKLTNENISRHLTSSYENLEK